MERIRNACAQIGVIVASMLWCPGWCETNEAGHACSMRQAAGDLHCDSRRVSLPRPSSCEGPASQSQEYRLLAVVEWVKSQHIKALHHPILDMWLHQYLLQRCVSDLT